MKKKITLSAEFVYVLAIVLLAFAVAMVTAANFGVSMIVAPAYVFSQRFPVFTFGQAEYVVQSAVFIAMCVVLRKFRFVYFTSYLTCLFYGAVLDAWRAVVPVFRESASLSMPSRIALFVGGMLLTSFSVALFFRTYICPQVYDFAVKTVSSHFRIKLPTFKRAFDACCLIAAAVLALCFFGGELADFDLAVFAANGFNFHGIGIATVVMTFLNGGLIGWFGEKFDDLVEVRSRFPKAEAFFTA